MKKYNKKAIMMKAWEIRRRLNVTMSVALKDAWALEKALKKAEEVAAEIDWNTSIKVNDWAKGGHDRTYVEVAIHQRMEPQAHREDWLHQQPDR